MSTPTFALIQDLTIASAISDTETRWPIVTGADSSPTVEALSLDILNMQAYYAKPVATATDLRNVNQAFTRNGQVVKALDTNTEYRYDANSNLADDGSTILAPTWATTTGRFLEIVSGGGGAGNTDLSLGSISATTLEIASSTGNNVTLSGANATQAGLLSSAQWLQLQELPVSFNEFQEEVEDAIAAMLTDSAEISGTYNDSLGTYSFQLNDGSVSLARLANVGPATLLGNSTGVAGAIGEITLGTGLQFNGGVLEATGGGSGGGAIAIEDEGTQISASATKLNFVGSSVLATETAAGEITVTIDAELSGDLYTQTILQLNLDGPDTSQIFTDSSSFTRTPTIIGATAQTTSQSAIQSASIDFNGTTDALRYAATPEMIASGDMSIEAFVRLTTLTLATGSANRSILSFANTTLGLATPALLLNTSGNVLYVDTTTRITSAAALTVNNFHHVALCRVDGVWTIYIDGIGSGTYASTATITPAMLRLGSSVGDTVGNLQGQLDGIRWVVGQSAYTGNFTPPTAPYSDSPAPLAQPITIEQNGSEITGSLSKLNFVGATAVETNAGEVTVTIAGGGSGGGSGALEFVSELVATGGETSLDFTGLSGEDRYYIQAELGISADNYILLYVNGDTVNGNYSGNNVFSTQGAASGSQVALPRVAYSYANRSGSVVELSVTRTEIDDSILYMSNTVYEASTASTTSSGRYAVRHDVEGQADITSLSFVPEGGPTFTAGTKIRLYKYNNTPASGGASGLTVQAPITADPATASPNSIYLLDSSGGSFNVTLPAGTDGDQLSFADHAGTSTVTPTGLGANSVTIVPDGSETIQGQANLVLDTDNQSVRLVFYGTRWTITD